METPTGPAEPAAPRPAPVASAERIELVDVLRGFALLGILLVNMEYFGSSMYHTLAGMRRPSGTADRAAEWGVRLLAESKFYSLFSMLFGLGLVLQSGRIEARGGRFGWLYARRLLVLLAFGLAHSYLVWYGDILTAYATIGFVLLVFRRRSPRTLLVWAFALQGLAVLVGAGGVGLERLGSEKERKAQEREYRDEAQRSEQAYGRGSWREIQRQRVRDVTFGYVFFILMLPMILAMFLLGIWLARRDCLARPAEHLAFLRRLLAGGLAVGLPLNALYVVATARGWEITALAAVAAGAPTLTLAYVAAIALVFQLEAGRRLLSWLAWPGRMALTNYLLQSLVCTTLFYSYGLGLYGRVGQAAGVLLAVAMFCAQVPLSRWWLARFRYGPAEWLWRSLTYLRVQPMRAAREPGR